MDAKPPGPAAQKQDPGNLRSVWGSRAILEQLSDLLKDT